MKIAILSGEIPTTTFIDRLVQGLAKNHTEVIVMGNKYKTPEPRNGITYIGVNKKLGRWGAYLFTFYYAAKLRLFRASEKRKLDSLLDASGKMLTVTKGYPYAILWHKPEVVHVQWARGIESFLWVQNFGMKLVVSLRGAHINYSPITETGLAAIYRQTFPKIDGFHGVSHAICREASKYGADLEKCKVAYSGFDLSQFPKSAWRNDFETLAARPLKIISVGRSHWKKGYHFALDAMAILKTQKIDFQYDIIGAAVNEELLFQKDQLDLSAQVTFLNKVPFARVKQLIREADVLLLPSVEEGIANVVLEAMLLGTLVLTTDCGGMEESVQHEVSGFVVPVRDVKAIAENLVRIKQSAPEVLHQIVENAYENTAKQHNEDKMVADMLALYKTVTH